MLKSLGFILKKMEAHLSVLAREKYHQISLYYSL
jgi:hypothetical protein